MPKVFGFERITALATAPALAAAIAMSACSPAKLSWTSGSTSLGGPDPLTLSTSLAGPYTVDSCVPIQAAPFSASTPFPFSVTLSSPDSSLTLWTTSDCATTAHVGSWNVVAAASTIYAKTTKAGVLQINGLSPEVGSGSITLPVHPGNVNAFASLVELASPTHIAGSTSDRN